MRGQREVQHRVGNTPTKDRKRGHFVLANRHLKDHSLFLSLCFHYQSNLR
jgi:hypothetical protein